MTSNREHLNKLLADFQYWMHIEDPYIIYTLAAVKYTHQQPGDPVWLMIIGPSSDGKSEYLRAFRQGGEIAIESVTPQTFISGYLGKGGEKIDQFAEKLANRIWYIYDFGIIMSKHADERGKILSDLRLIYDGRISKVFGTGKVITIDCPNSTLIVGSTPAIDATILEDQILGTRWMMYRTHTGNRFKIMTKIDINEDRLAAMRDALTVSVQMFEESIHQEHYDMKEIENQNLQLLAHQTTILRTSVDLDRNKENRNIAYPESPGRLYKQLKKMYQAYRIIGLTEEEAIIGIRRLCKNSISPVRLNIIGWMMRNSDNIAHNTSRIAIGCKMGKGHTKGELSALTALGLVEHDEVDTNASGSFFKYEDQWRLLDGDYRLLMGSEPVVGIRQRGLSIRRCGL